MLVLCVVVCIVAGGSYLSGDEHFIDGSSLAISCLTLLLLPILQASQNRDGAALHAKLDELIKADEKARDALIGLEESCDDEIERVRVDEGGH